MCIDHVGSEGLVFWVFSIPSRSYTASASSFSGFPELRGVGFDGDIPFRTVCSKISHPLHNVQLWVAAFVPICCRRKRLWWWLSDDLFPGSECRSGVSFDLFKSEMPSTKRTPGIALSLSPSGTLLSHLGGLSVKLCLFFDVPLPLGYRSLQFSFCAPDHSPASLGMSPLDS